MPNLLVLDIIDWRIRDISDIHNLHELRVLDVNTYCDNKIDFSCFPKLEDISLEWRAKAKSIFKCSSLKSVFINNYAGRILEPFAKLKQLEHLALKSPRITRIGDIPTLGKLKFLELGNARNLTTLKGIEELANLETLMINTCRKITNIEPVMNLTKLKRLFICNWGDIESLCPISNLKELKEVHFYESTNILDGDLSPLKELPKLKETSFQERRHYNYRNQILVKNILLA